MTTDYKIRIPKGMICSSRIERSYLNLSCCLRYMRYQTAGTEHITGIVSATAFLPAPYNRKTYPEMNVEF